MNSQLVEFVSSLTRTPVRAGLAAGLASGIAGSSVVHAIFSHLDASRPVYYTTLAKMDETEKQDIPLSIRVTADIIDTFGSVSEMYVRASGASADSKKWSERMAEHHITALAARLTSMETDVAELQGFYKPFADGFGYLGSSSSALSACYDHRATDNEHVEFYTTTTCDSNNNCTTTITPNTVYDDTDHYWTPHTEQCDFGLQYYDQGIKMVKKGGDMPPAVNARLGEYIPSTTIDAVGRPVDTTEREKAAEEWQNHTLARDTNSIADVDIVKDNVRILMVQRMQRLSYPADSFYDFHVNNVCPSYTTGCDTQNAPRGYLISHQGAELLTNYLQPVYHLGSLLQQISAQARVISIELEKIRNEGKFEPVNLENLSWQAMEMYKTLIPESDVTPPSPTARTWWPFGVGLGLFLMGGVGGFLVKRHRDEQAQFRKRSYK